MLRNSLTDLKARFTEPTPERKLAAAIIGLAWEDTFAETEKKDPDRTTEYRRRRQEAIRWILHDTDFIYWCELSAMNVRAVRARFLTELTRCRIQP